MSTNSDYWKRWAKAALIRAIKTFAQALAASLATCTTIMDAPWTVALGTAALAAVLSMLTSLSGLPEVAEPTPGLFEDGEVIEDGDRE